MHLGQIAVEQPGKAAVIMAGSGQNVTFAELDAAANRVAHVLYGRSRPLSSRRRWTTPDRSWPRS